MRKRGQAPSRPSACPFFRSLLARRPSVAAGAQGNSPVVSGEHLVINATATMVGAGFTPGEADQLRRAMGAWKRRETYKTDWFEGGHAYVYPFEPDAASA